MRDSSNPSAQGWAMAARCLLAAALGVSALGLLAAPAAADPAEAAPVINTTVDQSLHDCSVTCSLRDAVFLSSPGDTLAVPAGHYVLTLGDIAITQSLTLAGAGARTTVIDGNNTSGGNTGGIFNMTGAISVELDDLSLINGVANLQGGAISAFGQIVSNPPLVTAPLALTIRRCTIANNQVTSGQAGGVALFVGTLDLEDSTISNNSTSPLGGSALLEDLVTGSIVNSTFTGNSEPTFANGSVVFISSTMSLTNNTITANSGGKGLRVFSSPLTLSNNIIAGNPGGDCQFTSSPAVTDHNLDSDNSCGLTGPGDLPGVNPLLAPLANYGGMTDTQALLAGSPAIDAGNNATCPATDQRGVSRPQGPACDIGAYEATRVTITVNSASVTVNEGQTATNGGTVSDFDGGAITLTASAGTVVNNGDGTWSWSFPATDPAQSQTVTITATANDGSSLAGSVSFGLTVVDVPPSILHVTNNGPILVGGTATITVNAADLTGGNDTLSYEFDCNDDGIFEIGPQAGNTATCTFATAGSHTVDVRVTDGEGGATLGSTVVLVNLDCSHATASPNLLWPPNNKFVAIQISGIPDPGGPTAAITVTSIFQDEPVTKGPDATGVGTSTPSVRAQRDGGGDGRVYHIFFTASGNGGSCTGAVTVGVPHDQGPNGGPVDEGPLYDSTQP